MTRRCWMVLAVLCLTGPAMAEDLIDWAAEAAKDRRFFDFTLPEPGEVTYSATGCRVPPEPVITIGENETGVKPYVLDTLLKNIQWAQSYTKIISDQTCSCEMLFPEWSNALEEFNTLISVRTFEEWRRLTKHYVVIRENASKEMERICEAAGVL